MSYKGTLIHTITKEDVDKVSVEINGERYMWEDCIGRVMEGDIGKLVYLIPYGAGGERPTGHVLQVENGGQMDARLNPELYEPETAFEQGFDGDTDQAVDPTAAFISHNSSGESKMNRVITDIVYRFYEEVEVEESQVLQVPWSDPKLYEYAYDFLFASAAEAWERKKEDAPEEDWMLVRETTVTEVLEI